MVKGNNHRRGEKKNNYKTEKKSKQKSDRVNADTKETSGDFSSFQTDIQHLFSNPQLHFRHVILCN